jgi:hypothetical protein
MATSFLHPENTMKNMLIAINKFNFFILLLLVLCKGINLILNKCFRVLLRINKKQ